MRILSTSLAVLATAFFAAQSYAGDDVSGTEEQKQELPTEQEQQKAVEEDAKDQKALDEKTAQDEMANPEPLQDSTEIDELINEEDAADANEVESYRDRDDRDRRWRDRDDRWRHRRDRDDRWRRRRVVIVPWRPFPFPGFRRAMVCFAQDRRGNTFRARGYGHSWALQREALRRCHRNSFVPRSCHSLGCRRRW